MSHGGAAEPDTIEVNLIPMIDIVIQLITFFLMLVNFGNANADERIRLPIADLARPEGSNVEEALVLNVDQSGNIKFVGQQYDLNSPVLRAQLKKEADAAVLSMRVHGQDVPTDGSPAKLWTTVLIRADKEVEYGR